MVQTVPEASKERRNRVHCQRLPEKVRHFQIPQPGCQSCLRLTGNHNDPGGFGKALQPPQQVRAAHAGQPEINDDGIRNGREILRHVGFRVGIRAWIIAKLTQQKDERLAHAAIVFDYMNAQCLRRFAILDRCGASAEKNTCRFDTCQNPRQSEVDAGLCLRHHQRPRKTLRFN